MRVTKPRARTKREVGSRSESGMTHRRILPKIDLEIFPWIRARHLGLTRTGREACQGFPKDLPSLSYSGTTRFNFTRKLLTCSTPNILTKIITVAVIKGFVSSPFIFHLSFILLGLVFSTRISRFLDGRCAEVRRTSGPRIHRTLLPGTTFRVRPCTPAHFDSNKPVTTKNVRY